MRHRKGARTTRRRPSATRLRQYHELTELVVDRYQVAGIEVIVDGEQAMDEVFAAIQDALEGVGANR